MKHRSAAVLLSAFILTAAVPFTAFAVDNTEITETSEYEKDTVFEENGLEYRLYQTDPPRLEVKRCLSEDEEIEIPEVVNGFIVDSIGEYSFEKVKTLGALKLPESIRYIRNHAFFQCSRLRDVTFPNCLENIEFLAFSNCDRLSPVKLNKGLTELGFAAFQSCGAITSLTVPPRVEVFSEYACNFTHDLYTLRLCNGVQKIGGHAAQNNYYQKRVIIPPSVTEIGDHAVGYLFQKGEYQGLNEAVIYGEKGTAAEAYAAENGMPFVEFDFRYGDMNSDGAVNALDASVVLSEYARTSTDAGGEGFTEAQKLKSDLNDDFAVNAYDASLILSYYAYTSTGGGETPEEFFFLR